MMNRRNFLVTATATMATAATYAHAQDFPSVADVLFDPQIPVLGNPNGDVTVVEFFDYQCPYCKANHPDLLDVVKKDGYVRLVMKDWPIFGAPSLYASNLVLAAGDDYEDAHKAIMKTKARLTEDMIDEALKSAGLDPEPLMTRYQNDRARVDGIIDRNMAQASAFRFGGTPAFLFNTKIYQGALSRSDIKAAVEMARS
ncbi:DsbA family protein [Nitratireductor sp. CH_MIT9313-5]|uniref:DsbA family protein n=1 Tax=Nitratireductor sp. CH_MIT9313-5 TaxID=3107764 RepID=UPI00300B72BF